MHIHLFNISLTNNINKFSFKNSLIARTSLISFVTIETLFPMKNAMEFINLISGRVELIAQLEKCGVLLVHFVDN